VSKVISLIVRKEELGSNIFLPMLGFGKASSPNGGIVVPLEKVRVVYTPALILAVAINLVFL
jgi:hypothetical protein